MTSPADSFTLDALVQLSFTMHQRLEASAARAGVSVTQSRLLGILRDREPTIGELADHLDLGKSSVSGLIDRAAQRGLVSRSTDPDDGRSVRVRLEPAGRALIDGAVTTLEEEMHDVIAALTPAERRDWAALTVRMLAADAAGRGEGGPFGQAPVLAR